MNEPHDTSRKGSVWARRLRLAGIVAGASAMAVVGALLEACRSPAGPSVSTGEAPPIKPEPKTTAEPPAPPAPPPSASAPPPPSASAPPMPSASATASARPGSESKPLPPPTATATRKGRPKDSGIIYE